MKELKKLATSNNKKLITVMPLNTVEEVLLNECAYSIANQKYPTDLLILANGLSKEEIDTVTSIMEKPAIKIPKKNEATGQVEQETIESENSVNFTIENTEKSNFCQVFNEAFNYATTNGYEWISPIEYDDVLDANLYQWFTKYSEEMDDVQGFLPMLREISNGTFLGFFNEASWSEGMAEVAGQTDLQLLLKFSCLNLTGGIYNVAAIQEYCEQDENDYYKPLKESLELSYPYEFFLRMVYNDIKFFTIPRVGYEHRVDRHGDKVNEFTSKIPKDLTSRTTENGGKTMEEIQFWIESAKKEYFYDEDRGITFTPAVAEVQ